LIQRLQYEVTNEVAPHNFEKPSQTFFKNYFADGYVT
jgi:hypothetical protein